MNNFNFQISNRKSRNNNCGQASPLIRSRIRGSAVSPNSSSLNVRRPSQRFAFTLVELLVTITVLAILASLLLGALFAAQDAARAQKTRSTIAKLHGLMMDRWESYRTRRLPIELPVQPSKADEARLKTLAPGAEVLRVAGAGPFLMLEKPDAVNAPLLDFLSRHSFLRAVR